MFALLVKRTGVPAPWLCELYGLNICKHITNQSRVGKGGGYSPNNKMDTNQKRFLDFLVENGDFETARMYLANMMEKVEKVDSDVPKDDISRALPIVYGCDEEVLTKENISSSKFVREGYVLEVNLENVTRKDLESVIGYLTTQRSLYNVKKMVFPCDPAIATDLIVRVFDNTLQPNKFLSLFRFENVPSATSADILFNHFTVYKDFVRDMVHWSGKYDCFGIYFLVDVPYEKKSVREDYVLHTRKQNVGELPTYRCCLVFRR